jgi:hypothetical protein
VLDGEEAPTIAPEPNDFCPQREDTAAREGDEDDEAIVDDEDESDEDDAPPAPKEAPEGYRINATQPSAEQLAFSKEASPADSLVGRSILYHCVWGSQTRISDLRT